MRIQGPSEYPKISNLQRPYFQIKSHLQVLEIRTQTYILEVIIKPENDIGNYTKFLECGPEVWLYLYLRKNGEKKTEYNVFHSGP
jgi:hypothetical protein